MPALAEEFMGRNVLLVTYDPAQRDAISRTRFRRVVAKAVENGIRQIRYSPMLDPTIVSEIRLGANTSRIVVVEEASLQVAQRAFDYATLMISATTDRVPFGIAYPLPDAVPRLLLIPALTPTPDRPHLNFEDVIHPNVTLAELVVRI